ncbi:protein of unknown function DUF924 [Rivularia sp. IAM M-261]|nr:protein of unknown function DUF924 [Rivularia sp. IAM M-261]
MKTVQSEDVLSFWFPGLPTNDIAAMVRIWEWWFRGGTGTYINEHFIPLLKQAAIGELDSWSKAPRSRLALIIILDQFSRTIYRGTAQAFAIDSKACALTLQGIDIGHYAALENPWEKTFFFLPLGHSENIKNQELAVELAEQLVLEAPLQYRALLEFSASQACGHRDVIARFGRHPHRNEVLGRQSTTEELEYLTSSQLVHTRSMPSNLSQFLSNS